MLTHLSQETLYRYLDGSLGDASRRNVWHHLQGCARCQRRLQDESSVRDDLRVELSVINAAGKRDLGNLLPGIINEARQPAAQRVKRSAAALIVVLVFVTVMPLLRHAEDTRPQGPLVNVPRATQIVDDELQHIATEESSTPISREISLKYASPVPPPPQASGQPTESSN